MNDKYIIPVFVAGSLLLTLFGLFLIIYLLAQKKARNSHLLERQQMIFDHENNILRTKLEEQESIMDQISKELHDNIKSVLGFAQFNMYRIANLAKSSEQLVLIEKTNGIIETALNDLHNISHSMNSNFVKNIGLAETITKELDNIRLAKGIDCSLTITGEQFSLGEEKELHIFRIAQEALQNCAKHANASKLSLVLEYDLTFFKMSIVDNGSGFDKNKIHEMKGLGFINMFQRARFVHGMLEVQSGVQEGSSVILKLNTDNNGSTN